MSETIQKPDVLLQGYTLVDRLGAGGYGEVWRAEAPGGLTKAVKYVFGRQGEARATAELHALERVKGVRHPFLLSLERIEVIDGRLIVVTELADGSLRDRCHECHQEGLPGIPREELLGYVRDAADALDFLNREHDLQHLDIKPENLLLLAGHVKVADFGLVKSVSQQTQSLVGGMTPMYSAPEVFQGRPSKHSDQYSLAILYHELLTGETPFSGANVAELTMQHLSDDPDLSRLPEDDRFVLSRALSKEPEHRFDCCSDMIRALANGDRHGMGGVPAPAANPTRRVGPIPAAPSYSATEVFEEGDDPVRVLPEGAILIDVPTLEEPRVRYAAAPEFDPAGFSPSPALFIGIGGAAGQVLRSLKRRLAERFDGLASPPAMPMLLLDTDAKSLIAATRSGNQGPGLTKDETIALPLRRPQDYRDKSAMLLKWLGRRWLYNVPRSLQTEGIRPLGRLALVDHARQTFQRIRRAMSEAAAEESIEATEQQTGLNFQRDKLRVYVCGSISGGAGSGMSLDVAYAVRSILKRLQLADAKIIGVMLHATSRDPRRGELARVNAYSWLAEHHHFSQADSVYPGDEGCGLPSHEPGTPAFDDTYLVSLGAGVDAAAFEAATASVADYLYLDALTPAQSLLDACRREPTSAGLRSFSLTREEGLPRGVVEATAAASSNTLVAKWLGEESGDSEAELRAGAGANPSTNPIVHGAAQLVSRLKLDAAGLASLSRTLLEARIGTSVEQLAAVLGQGPEAGVADWAGVVAPIERLFASADESRPSDLNRPASFAGRPLSVHTQPLLEKISADLHAWALNRINHPGERISGARRAVDWLRDHLASLEADLPRLFEAVNRLASEWEAEATVADWNTQAPPQVNAARAKRLRLSIDLASIVAAAGLVEALGEKLRGVEGLIDRCGGSLASLRRPVTDEICQDVQSQLPEIIEEVERRVESELLTVSGGLASVLSDEALTRRFGEGLGTLVEKVVAGRLGHAKTINAAIEQADCQAPLTNDAGATLRRFVLRPESFSAPAGDRDRPLADVIGAEPCLTWGCEAEGLPTARVAAEIVGRRRDYATLGERVHTRKDIEWSDLMQSLQPQQKDAPAIGFNVNSSLNLNPA